MKANKFKYLVLSSLILSTLAQPVGVLATTELNNSHIQTKEVSTKAIANPNLMKISSKSVVSDTNIWGNANRWQTVDWNESTTKGAVEGEKLGFTDLKSVTGGKKFSISGLLVKPIDVQIIDGKSISMTTTGSDPNYGIGIGQNISTEVGKEYTFSLDYKSDFKNGQITLVVNNRAYAPKTGYSGSSSFTMTATKNKTFVYFFFAPESGALLNTTTLTNIKAVKSKGQVASEELALLLPTFFDADGNLGSEITATDLAKAQALLDKITAGATKNKLQATFDKATELLNQRTALTAVSHLFENNDIENTAIKNTVTQASLDSVKTLINKVKDTEKNKALTTYLAKAQEYYNQNQASDLLASLYVDNDPAGEVIGNLTQAMIDQVNALISKVTDEERKAALQAGSDKVQAVLDARIEEANNQAVAEAAINHLFKNSNPATGVIVEKLEQTTIDAAIALANKVTDETKKASLIETANKAQNLLNERLAEEAKVASARDEIANLFQDSTIENGIRTDLTQAEIDNASKSVETIKDATIQKELNAQIATAQQGLNALNAEKEKTAEEAVNGLFQNNDPKTESIKGGLTQAMIDKAAGLAAAVVEEAKKAEYEANINVAQILLDERLAEADRQAKALDAVNSLFVDQNPASGEITATVNQAAIIAAQELIDAVTSPSKKEALQNILNAAQKLLTSRVEEENAQKAATEAVNALFKDKNPTTGAISQETTQKMIDAAKALVNKVTDTTVKEALLANIAKATELLEQQKAENAAIAAAQKEINALFEDNDPTTGKIIAGLAQSHIDAAKEAANKVTDADKKAELLATIETAQKELDKQATEEVNKAAAEKAVNELFTDNDPTTETIKEGVTQAAIDAAKEAANKVTDADKKAELLATIETAQKELDKQTTEKENQTAAEKAVNELFTDSDPTTGTIKEGVTQATIDAAKEAANKVTDADKKAELLATIETAQKELDKQTTEKENQTAAEKAVNELFTDSDPKTGTIKEGVTQATIDAAKEAANKVTDTDKKAELLATIETAQKELDKQTTEKENQTAAEKAVNELFKDESHASLADKITQEDITAASELVSKLSDGEVKNQLLNEIKKAEELIKADDKLEITPFEIGKSRYVEGTITDSNVKKITLKVNGKVLKQINANEGNFKYWALDQIKSALDEVYLLAYDASGKEIIQQKVKVIESEDSSTLTPNTFVIGKDNYITGTYSGTITRVALRIDGVLTQRILVNDNIIKYYAKDKIKTDSSKVEIVGFNVAGVEVSAQEVKVSNVISTFSVANYRIGEGYVTGTYTGDAKYIGITVNGIQKQVIQIKDNAFKYYAKDKILSGTDDVRITLYDGNKVALDMKKLSIIQTKGTIELNEYKLNNAYIEGTYTDDVVKVRLVVNGVTQKTIPVSNGVIKYYARNIVANQTDKAAIVGLDSTGNILDTKDLIITE